jgi:hypothetical protein
MLAGAAIGGITAAITTPNGGNYTSNILTGIVLGAGSGAAVASGTWVGLLLGIIVESGNVANACR